MKSKVIEKNAKKGKMQTRLILKITISSLSKKTRAHSFNAIRLYSTT